MQNFSIGHLYIIRKFLLKAFTKKWYIYFVIQKVCLFFKWINNCTSLMTPICLQKCHQCQTSMLLCLYSFEVFNEKEKLKGKAI